MALVANVRFGMVHIGLDSPFFKCHPGPTRLSRSSSNDCRRGARRLIVLLDCSTTRGLVVYTCAGVKRIMEREQRECMKEARTDISRHDIYRCNPVAMPGRHGIGQDG